MRALLLASALLLATVGTARAADCGNVTVEGVCQDAKTLVFCEDGELETIRCPTGELCITNVDRFNGAAGCIATRYTGCGAVPEQGLCAGSTLLYCANGRVEELECPTGTDCEPVDYGEDDFDFDCVPVSGTSGASGAPETDGDDNATEPVQPGDDTDGTANPTPVEPSGGAPLPSVEKGGAGPAADYDSDDPGCSGGAGAGLLGLLVIIRRRRSA